MKKNKLINKLVFALGISAMVFACDDDAGVNTSAGFAGIGSSYAEADGPGTVFIPFRDGSVSESDITVDGSATDGADYTWSYSEDGITVTVNDDEAAEHPETVRFTIGGAKGASNRTHTLTIVSDDDGWMDIDLTWAAGPDMDLHLVYRKSDADGWHLMPGAANIFSAQGFSDPGHLRLNWKAADGQYGMAYNYYAGSVDPLAFTVTFTPTNTTVEGETTPLVFNGSLGVDQQIDPGAIGDLFINQIFTKKGPAYSDFTPISVPEVEED